MRCVVEVSKEKRARKTARHASLKLSAFFLLNRSKALKTAHGMEPRGMEHGSTRMKRIITDIINYELGVARRRRAMVALVCNVYVGVRGGSLDSHEKAFEWTG
jgi:hypothetical protein